MELAQRTDSGRSDTSPAVVKERTLDRLVYFNGPFEVRNLSAWPTPNSSLAFHIHPRLGSRMPQETKTQSVPLARGGFSEAPPVR